MTTITIHCDGLCEDRNPGGYGCWAWIAFVPSGKILNSAYGCLSQRPTMSNNIAEYTAVIKVLAHAWEYRKGLIARGASLALKTDSQLIVNQINGEWACTKAPLIELRDEALRRINGLRAAGVPVTVTWIPREQNEQADALARQAYKEARRQAMTDTVDLPL